MGKVDGAASLIGHDSEPQVFEAGACSLEEDGLHWLEKRFGVFGSMKKDFSFSIKQPQDELAL